MWERTLRVVSRSILWQFLATIFLFIYFSALQYRIDARYVEGLMLFQSFSLLFCAFFNFGSEHRFVDVKAASFFSFFRVLSVGRLSYYVVVSLLGVVLSILPQVEWLQTSPFLVIGSLFVFLVSLFVYNHLSFLLVARNRNDFLLFSNFLGTAIMAVGIVFNSDASLEYALVVTALGGFIKALLVTFLTWKLLRFGCVGRDACEVDGIFNKKYFIASLGTPLGFGIGFLTNTVIALNYSSEEAVAILLGLRILNQAMAFSTSIASPVVYRILTNTSGRKSLSLFNIPVFASMFAVIIVSICVLELGFLNLVISYIFQTVSVESAKYYLYWLIPPFIAGALAGAFYHSFVSLGGSAIRNSLFIFRLFVVLLVGYAGVAHYSLPVFEILVVIDVAVSCMYSMMLMRLANRQRQV